MAKRRKKPVTLSPMEWALAASQIKSAYQLPQSAISLPSPREEESDFEFAPWNSVDTGVPGEKDEDKSILGFGENVITGGAKNVAGIFKGLYDIGESVGHDVILGTTGKDIGKDEGYKSDNLAKDMYKGAKQYYTGDSFWGNTGRAVGNSVKGIGAVVRGDLEEADRLEDKVIKQIKKAGNEFYDDPTSPLIDVAGVALGGAGTAAKGASMAGKGMAAARLGEKAGVAESAAAKFAKLAGLDEATLGKTAGYRVKGGEIVTNKNSQPVLDELLYKPGEGVKRRSEVEEGRDLDLEANELATAEAADIAAAKLGGTKEELLSKVENAKIVQTKAEEDIKAIKAPAVEDRFDTDKIVNARTKVAEHEAKMEDLRVERDRLKEEGIKADREKHAKKIDAQRKAIDRSKENLNGLIQERTDALQKETNVAVKDMSAAARFAKRESDDALQKANRFDNEVAITSKRLGYTPEKVLEREGYLARPLSKNPLARGVQVGTLNRFEGLAARTAGSGQRRVNQRRAMELKQERKAYIAAIGPMTDREKLAAKIMAQVEGSGGVLTAQHQLDMLTNNLANGIEVDPKRIALLEDVIESGIMDNPPENVVKAARIYSDLDDGTLVPQTISNMAALNEAEAIDNRTAAIKEALPEGASIPPVLGQVLPGRRMTELKPGIADDFDKVAGSLQETTLAKNQRKENTGVNRARGLETIEPEDIISQFMSNKDSSNKFVAQAKVGLVHKVITDEQLAKMTDKQRKKVYLIEELPEYKIWQKAIENYMDPDAGWVRSQVADMSPEIHEYAMNLKAIMAKNTGQNKVVIDKAYMDSVSPKITDRGKIAQGAEELSQVAKDIMLATPRYFVNNVLGMLMILGKEMRPGRMGNIRHAINTERRKMMEEALPDMFQNGLADERIGQGFMRAKDSKNAGIAAAGRGYEHWRNFNTKWTDDAMRGVLSADEMDVVMGEFMGAKKYKALTEQEKIKAMKEYLADDTNRDKFAERIYARGVDYQMTDTERKWMRLAFPFWAWQRGMTKAAATTFVNQPIKMLAMMNLSRYGWDEMVEFFGGEENMPDWAASLLPIGTDENGRDKFLNTGGANIWLTPVQTAQAVGGLVGLTKSPGATGTPISGLNPILKMPIEFFMNQNTFTGEKHSETGNPLEKAKNQMAELIPYARILADKRKKEDIELGIKNPSGLDPEPTDRAMNLLLGLPIRRGSVEDFQARAATDAYYEMLDEQEKEWVDYLRSQKK